jgi:tRNA(Ile)-lysidine synthase
VNSTVDTINPRVAEAVASLGARKLLVAFSGGADSTCLLWALLATVGHAVVGACYVRHGLRSGDVADREHVETMCRRRGVDIHVRDVDTKALMHDEGLSMEVAARLLRYGALREVAAEIGAAHIALGHTSDDQVETVLMHEFRGAGLTGLAGMRVWRGDLFRPLLTTSHAETVEYCRDSALDFLEDPSNSDVSILRNALRHNLLPAIERMYPGARGAILRLASTAGRDVDYLDCLAQEAITHAAPDGVVIPVVWAVLPESLRWNVLRLLAPREGNVMRSEELDAWASRLITLSKGTHTTRGRNLVVFDQEQTSPTCLRIPGVHQVGGVRFESYVRAADAGLLRKVGLAMPGQAYMDADRLPGELSVRSWLPGDKIRPLGMSGSKKVQDVFVDRRVAREMRHRVPVVESWGRIVWIAGVALSDEVTVRAATTRVLHLGVRPARHKASMTAHCLE